MGGRDNPKKNKKKHLIIIRLSVGRGLNLKAPVHPTNDVFMYMVPIIGG